MQVKLSNGQMAIMNEATESLIIRDKNRLIARIKLNDGDFDLLYSLIGKYINRYKLDEVQELFDMVNRLSAAMKEKLEIKYFEGYTEWNNPEFKADLIISMLEHLKKGDMLDAINLAAFIWNMEKVEGE